MFMNAATRGAGRGSSVCCPALLTLEEDHLQGWDTPITDQITGGPQEAGLPCSTSMPLPLNAYNSVPDLGVQACARIVPRELWKAGGRCHIPVPWGWGRQVYS